MDGFRRRFLGGYITKNLLLNKFTRYVAQNHNLLKIIVAYKDVGNSSIPTLYDPVFLPFGVFQLQPGQLQISL